MNSENRLGTQKIWKLCIIMGLPCVLAQVVNLLYNIVDRIYIGNMPNVGPDALAGLGLVAPIITLISAFSSFVSGGGAPLAAKALGEGKKDRAFKILGNGVTMLIIFSLLLMGIVYIFKIDILKLIGASDVTLTYANDYLSIYLIGTIFVQISVGLNTFLTAQGRSMLAMISVLIGAVLNIVLDPLFIFTFGMGIQGAALATIVSQFFSAVFVLVVLTNKRTSLHIRLKNMIPDIKILGGILALGLAPFVMSATESVIGFALNGQLAKYGDIYVSTLAVLQSVMMLISVPISGFTQGVTPVISYNFGAKNKNRLKQCVFLTMIVCLVYCTLFAGIIMIAPRWFGQMFTSDLELLKITDQYLPIFVSGMLIFGIQRACQTTFVAVGEAGISLGIAMLRKIILLVPLAYILPIFMKVSGVFYAECIADFTAATLCGIIFMLRFKSIVRKMDEEVILDSEAV